MRYTRMTQIIADDLDVRTRSFPKRRALDPSTLDALAERQFKLKIKGSYNKRNKICKECFAYKSTSGSCNCEI